MPYDIAFVRCSSTASSTSSTSSPTKSAAASPSPPAYGALVSADDKTYYSYAAQMSYAAYQALNP